MTEELETIFPTNTTEVKVGGKSINLKPFTFGQLPRVMKLLSKLTSEDSPVVGKNFTDSAVLMQVFALFGDDIIELIAYCINEPKEFVANLSQTEAIQLVTKFLEVNSDFFIKSVMPAMREKLSGQEVGALL